MHVNVFDVWLMWAVHHLSPDSVKMMDERCFESKVRET